jgi:glutamate synthase domain-containing protein 2
MKAEQIANLADLESLRPARVHVRGVDLVLVRWEHGENISVLYGRCIHRGALLSDGCIEGENLVCGLHGWDYRYRTGVSQYNNSERLERFTAWIDDGGVFVDTDEIDAWVRDNPQPYDRGAYQGVYQDPVGTPDEPNVKMIRELAAHGLERTGSHGPSGAMGVPRSKLPSWDDLQVVTAQLATPPLLDDDAVGTNLVIGPSAKRPLHLKIPVFVSDMSFGALSQEAKTALAMGAERAGTAIASGEGGALPEEQTESSRYLYELASARFGFSWDIVEQSEAFHFKSGQAAKTGTGGHLPGAKVTPKIASVRDIPIGETAVSPARFPDWETPADFRAFANEVRDHTGGVPIGFKLSAQHIEEDLDAAIEVGVDYVILDGRGGGTGSAPLLFRDNISIPTIPALARARRHLDAAGADDVTLIITGGLRTPADFAKALALGADGIAVSNAALQSIGCIGMRACHTNNCPVGIATQREDLRSRLPVDDAADRLARYFASSVALMQVLARACGHRHLSEFSPDDLTTFERDMADLSGVGFAGAGPA